MEGVGEAFIKGYVPVVAFVGGGEGVGEAFIKGYVPVVAFVGGGEGVGAACKYDAKTKIIKIRMTKFSQKKRV